MASFSGRLQLLVSRFFFLARFVNTFLTDLMLPSSLLSPIFRVRNIVRVK